MSKEVLYLPVKTQNMNTNDIRIGAKVINTRAKVPKLLTIVADPMFPIRDYPNQKLPAANEVMLQTVVNNPWMFDLDHDPTIMQDAPTAGDVIDESF